MRAVRWPVPSSRSLGTLSRDTRAKRNPSDDPWPTDHDYLTREYEPMTTADAYLRTLVTGNDGAVEVRDLTRGGPGAAVDYARAIVVEEPLAWFDRRPKGRVRLAIYAHGGLNGEAASIERVRVLAPCFAANGVYPLFLTWRTGPGETILSSLEDWTARIPGAREERVAGPLEWLAEQKDRAIEIAGRLFGRGVWSEMRENAARGVRQEHGLDLTARSLVALAAELKKRGRPLELHLVGHSAGSILLGHLLERLGRDDLVGAAPRIGSCTLYAAACSSRFAVERYLAAADKGLLSLDRLWLYVLSDANEKRDGLPSPKVAAYGKSLLYLVSRALDDVRKTPLLGMERALVAGFHDARSAAARAQWDAAELPFVAQWQKRWPADPGLLRVVDTPTVRNTRTGQRVQATHGSFDNNIDALTETLERIAGHKLRAPLEWLDY
jgi:hypothetical protein